MSLDGIDNDGDPTANAGLGENDHLVDIQNVNGGGGDDTLTGDAGNNALNGNGGADTINGGDGDDAINGNAGNDTLDGQLGNDAVNGGDDTEP